MTGTITGRQWVKFRFSGQPGMEVFLTGAFNDWQPAQFRMKDRHGDGTYTTSLLLRKGRTEYKFIVNGDWCTDPLCQETATADNGAVNSVVNVA